MAQVGLPNYVVKSIEVNHDDEARFLQKPGDKHPCLLLGQADLRQETNVYTACESAKSDG